MLIASARAAIQGMHQIAKQAYVLATGLQNAAPPGTPLQSVQYLLETAAQLEKTCGEIEELLKTSSPQRGE
ncbi:MAG: hypothetical protein K0S27_1532 [Gammaproteobacteria bacterium]|jgi:hypothetical protein|nr:hypothetical protein [Gammaproteobacteria bacterium]